MSTMDRHSADERLDTGSVAEEQSSAPAGITAPVSAAAVSGAATVAASSKAAAEYRQTADEHVKTLKDFWKDFLVSGIFILAAIVIIFACLAWFAANNRVSATGSSISAQGARFTLTSEVKSGQDHHPGTYDSQMSRSDDTLSFDVTTESNLNNYTEGGLYPGARGVLSFTVTPIAKDLQGVTIDLSRVIKTQDEVDTTKMPLDETSRNALINLLKGHLLFFRNMDENGYYSNRVTNSRVVLQKDDFCEKDENGKVPSTKTTEPVTVHLYWVWPEYIQNFVLTGNANYYKNLFAGADPVKNPDYSSLQTYVNGHYGEFYSSDANGTSATTGVPDLSSAMSSTDLATCAALYNNADEFIGTNVAYIQLKINAREGVQ